MQIKCKYCGEPMIWQSDFTSGEVNGETGDPEIDERIVSFWECPDCEWLVQYTEGEGLTE